MHLPQYQIQLLGPRVPAQVLIRFGTSGGSKFRFAPLDLKMAELGVRHQFAVDEQGSADARTQGQQEHGARHAARGAVAQFGESRRVGIVESEPGAPQTRAGQAGEGISDPCLVEIGRRAHGAVAYHAGKCQAHRVIAGDVRYCRLQGGQQGFGGVLRWGRYTEALAGKRARAQIHQRTFEGGSADVDADSQWGGSQFKLRIVRSARRPFVKVPIITPYMNSTDTQFTTRRNVALQPGALLAALLDRLNRTLGKTVESATARDIYDALSLAVREELTLRWLATQRRVANAHVKRVCYFSVEYLPGRSLMNALSCLDGDLVREARSALKSMGLELEDVAAQEVDPGLGNGGLGRLAACFLDSLATLQYPAVGYGIRYDYGIFTQVIGPDGGQREVASSWLRLRNVWETPRGNVRFTVRFGGRIDAEETGAPGDLGRWVGTSDIYAIGFDQLIPGNRGPTVNHLRLWSGRAITPFHIDAFNAGDYAAAVREQVEAKNLSRVLYPDDSTPQGKELRLKQQYFFVSASLQDILATHLSEGRSLASMPDSIAIQLNDTHPAVAIPELMRLLVDEHGLSRAESGEITKGVFSYTNHTLLPEALESWPVTRCERLLPRHLEIIYLLNRDFLQAVATSYPDDPKRLRQMSIIDDGGDRRVRMSHLAIVGSHKVNGVAQLHSDIMRNHVFRDFAEMYPDRFINVTNGIAVRRWLKQSNPGLSALLTQHLGRAC